MKYPVSFRRWVWISVLLIPGLGRAQGQPAAAMDFAGLFQASVTNSSVKQVLVADDFEQGVVQRITRDPIGNETGYRFDAPAPRLRAHLSGVTLSNGATAITVSGEQASAGSKSIRFQPQPGLQPTLNWYLYGEDMPRRGRFRMSFDLMNNGTADCDLHIKAHDSSPHRAVLNRREQILFYLLCRRGGAQLGGAMGLPAGQWRHFEVDFPFGDPAGKAVLQVTDQGKNVQSVEYKLENVANAMNRISLTLTGAEGGQAFLDNLVIAVEE